MALSDNPTLAQIKTELASSNSKLSDFIYEAGKSGAWNKQSDFANYSPVVFSASAFELFYDNTFSNQDVTIISKPYNWQLYDKPTWVTIYPSTGGSVNVNITVNLNSGVPRNGYVILKQNSTDNYVYILISQAG
jgi:hypothetical protein